MTSENLLTIHRLPPFDATPGGVQRLPPSVEPSLASALLAHTRHWLQTKRSDLLLKDQ